MLDYSEPVVSQNVEQSLHLQQRSLIGGPRSGSDIDAVQSGPQSITNKWLTIAKLWWSIIILTAAAFLAFTPTVLAAQETHRPIACIVNCFTWCSSASQISAFCEWVSNPFFFKFRIRKWESRTGARRHKSRRIKQFKLPQTLDGLHGDLRGIRSSCRQLLLPRITLSCSLKRWTTALLTSSALWWVSLNCCWQGEMCKPFIIALCALLRHLSLLPNLHKQIVLHVHIVCCCWLLLNSLLHSIALRQQTTFSDLTLAL